MISTEATELVDRLAALRVMMSALAGIRSVDAVLSTASRHVPNIFSTDRSSVGLYDVEADAIRIIPLTGRNDAILTEGHQEKHQPIPRRQALLGRVIDSKRPDYVPDLRLDDRLHTQELLARGFLSTLAAPLRDGDECFGTLNLASESPNGFSDADRDALVVAADALSAALYTARLIEQLSKSAAQAEAASHAKSRFLATMSHELRTPLNGVIGMAQILDTTQLDEEQRGCVEIIESSGHSLLEMVEQVLTYTNLESGAVQPKPTRFEPRQLVERAVEQARGGADAKDLNLGWRADDLVPAVVVGPEATLAQMLQILLANAVKFTSSGGATITIEADASTIDPTASAPSGHLTISFAVTDTGMGIGGDDLQALFKRFGQLDDSTTRRYDGLGLGLATCGQLAETIGATINIESSLGVGTTVTISTAVAVDKHLG